MRIPQKVSFRLMNDCQGNQSDHTQLGGGYLLWQGGHHGKQDALQGVHGCCVMSGKSHETKISLELSQPTLFRVDGGAASTTLLLEPCLFTTGIGAEDLQNMLLTTFSEDDWAEEVLTFEGAEAAQTQIN